MYLTICTVTSPKVWYKTSARFLLEEFSRDLLICSLEPYLYPFHVINVIEWFVFIFQVTHHFLGFIGSKLHLMLLEDWSTFMSTQRIIMFIETSNRATSCSIVLSERRWYDMKLLISRFAWISYTSIQTETGFLFVDFGFWSCQTGGKVQWCRGFCHQSCGYFWLFGPRVSASCWSPGSGLRTNFWI
jgi:hypothetical protein